VQREGVVRRHPGGRDARDAVAAAEVEIGDRKPRRGMQRCGCREQCEDRDAY